MRYSNNEVRKATAVVVGSLSIAALGSSAINLRDSFEHDGKAEAYARQAQTLKRPALKNDAYYSAYDEAFQPNEAMRDATTALLWGFLLATMATGLAYSSKEVEDNEPEPKEEPESSPRNHFSPNVKRTLTAGALVGVSTLGLISAAEYKVIQHTSASVVYAELQHNKQAYQEVAEAGASADVRNLGFGVLMLTMVLTAGGAARLVKKEAEADQETDESDQI